MKTIEIKNVKGTVIFTHTCKDNTVLKTLEEAPRNWIGMKGADFKGADLRGADLRGAIFRGTDLRGTDLRGAKYNQRQIDLAITDETTIF